MKECGSWMEQGIATCWLSLECDMNRKETFITSSHWDLGAVGYSSWSPLTNTTHLLTPNFEPLWMSRLVLLIGEIWQILKQNSTKKDVFRQKYFPQISFLWGVCVCVFKTKRAFFSERNRLVLMFNNLLHALTTKISQIENSDLGRGEERGCPHQLWWPIITVATLLSILPASAVFGRVSNLWPFSIKVFPWRRILREELSN